jgi:hypothetical protein
LLGESPTTKLVDNLKSTIPSLVQDVYGDGSNAGLSERARTTGSYDPMKRSEAASDNLGNLELLKQMMIDLIGQVSSSASPQNPQLQGREMNMIAKLFVGNQKELDATGLDRDGLIYNTVDQLINTKNAFQTYGMKAQKVNPGDVNYEAINAAYETQRQRILFTMSKDFDFFESANDNFASVITTMGQLNGSNPIEILDLITSPDLVSDVDFIKLASGLQTSLDEKTDHALQKTFKLLSLQPLAITPEMRKGKNMQVWNNPDAKRASVMAQAVGIDVDAEVAAGISPQELVIKAAAVREQMGLALKSFMALAIPSNTDIRAAMNETYRNIGVGNSINWDEILPRPKGSKPIDKSDRYKAIADSFRQTPQQIAQKNSESAFLDNFQKGMEQNKMIPQAEQKSAEELIKNATRSSLLGGVYSLEKFIGVVKDLGIQKEVENNPSFKAAQAKIAAAPASEKASLEAEANMTALGQVFLKRSLAKAKSITGIDGAGIDRPSSGQSSSGLDTFVSSITKDDFDRLMFDAHVNRVKNSASTSGIEAVLSEIVPSSGSRMDKEKIRASAKLIAAGQLDLLAPDILLAVSSLTKKSISTLIQPAQDSQESKPIVDKVKVNTLRRLEIQKRLKSNGVDPAAFNQKLGVDGEDLYKGRLGKLNAQDSNRFEVIAETLNTNNKLGQEAVVELMASLSQQSLLNKHQEELNKQKFNFFKGKKRGSALDALAAESAATANTRESNERDKKKNSQKRFSNLLSLMIAQNPDKFDELSVYGLPVSGLGEKTQGVSEYPAVDKMIGDYNLVDIIKEIVGPSAVFNDDKIRKIVEKMVADSKGGGQGMTAQDSAYATPLLSKLGLTPSQFQDLANFSPEEALGTPEFDRVNQILRKMSQNQGKRRGRDVDEGVGTANKARKSVLRLESLLMKMTPSQSVKIVKNDPKGIMNENVNQLLKEAGLDTVREEGKPQLAETFYKDFLKGSKTPLSGTIEAIKTARAGIESSMTGADLSKPEIAKFMQELTQVQSDLEGASATGESSIPAMTKLIQLKKQIESSGANPAFAPLYDTALPVMSQQKLFGNKSSAMDIAPDLFGAVIDDSGAQQKMKKALPVGGMDLGSSSEYQLAELAASIEDLTGGYQVHSKKLIELRTKFAAGSDGFYELLLDTTNANLLKSADDSKLYDAMIAIYKHAATEGIDLKGAGLQGQLDRNVATPENLGIDQSQLDLLRQFSNTNNTSELTLDPTVRTSQDLLAQGKMLDRKQLNALKARTTSGDLDLYAKATPEQPNLTSLSPAEQFKADDLVGAIDSNLSGEFDFGMKEKRDLVDSLIAKGKATVTELGGAIANEYSIIYAHVDTETNKIDGSGIFSAMSGGVNLLDKVSTTSGVNKASGLKALIDIVEGRRDTIEKFNDDERNFLEAFRVEVGLSEKQLFDLQNAIPKTTFGKIFAILPNATSFFVKKYQKIKEQKTYSLNRFLERSGLDYEQLTGILKEEGFDSSQIEKIYVGHDRQRTVIQKIKDNSQKELISLLAKYGGMSKKAAKDSIVAKISQMTGVDKEADANSLRFFIEAEIKRQKYSKKVEAKILAQISASRRIGATGTRYEMATDPGMLLSDRLGASTEQMKRLASLMGVNREMLDRFFTDKGGVLGELAYAGDYFDIVKAALDPLNLNKQLARIFSGGKVGNFFARKAQKIEQKRNEKLYATRKSFKLINVVAPFIGSALQTFKTPAESALNWMIEFNANSSDWFNQNIAGRIVGGKGISKAFGSVEAELREVKFQAQKIDEMPTLKKVRTALWEKTGIPGLGRFIAQIGGVKPPAADRGGAIDPAIPSVTGAQSASIGGSNFQPDPSQSTAGLRERGSAKFASIKTGIKRSFTIDGAAENLADIVKMSIENRLAKGIEGMVAMIGGRIVAAADEAIEATAGLQIVTSRDDNGVRTYTNEQRSPLMTLQKKIGQGLIDRANPMKVLYKSLGNSMAKDAQSAVEVIELIEKGLKKIRSVTMPDRLQSVGQRISQFVAGLTQKGADPDSVAFSPEMLGSAVPSLKQKIFSTISAMFKAVGDTFSRLTQSSGGALKNAFNSIWGGIRASIAGLKQFGKKFRDRFTGKSPDEPPDDSSGGPSGGSPVPTPDPAPMSPAGNPVPTGNPVPAGNPVPIGPVPSNNPVSTDRDRRREAEQARVARNESLEQRANRLLNETGFDTNFDRNQVFDPIDPTARTRGVSNAVELSAPAIQVDAVPPIIQTASRLDTNIPMEAVAQSSSIPSTVNPVPSTSAVSAVEDPWVETQSSSIPSTVNPVASGVTMIPDAPVMADAVVPSVETPKTENEILSEELNRKIEENWNGTSDSIIKNIKNLALVSKKLGYWIMRNLSEGSPGPTYYMRQHYADTTDFIESDLKRLVTVAQRSGVAIQAGLAGEMIELNLADLPKASNLAIATNPVADNDFAGAIDQAEQFQSANIAAANLAVNAVVINDHTQDSAVAMAEVAKGEVKVDQKGRRLFKFFNVMWRAMKIVPKGFVKMGQVIKKIGKPVMMMGAGFSAAGFAIQNIGSNLATLGIISEQQSEVMQKGSAMMEIFGGIGAIGGAAMQVLTGGFALLMESSVALMALALNPVTYAVLGIGAAVGLGIFALNWLSKTFLGFDFIAPVFDGIGGSIGNLGALIMEKIAPAIGFLRFQFGQAFGYAALAQLDGAFKWFTDGLANGMQSVSGLLGFLKFQFGQTFGYGALAQFDGAIGWIAGAWATGIGAIGGMLGNLVKIAEDVGNWLIGALNCNPTVQIPLAWQSATDSIMGMMNYLPDHAKATADKMTGFFSSAFDWLGGRKPEDIKTNVDLTKTTTEATIVDSSTGSIVSSKTPSTGLSSPIPAMETTLMPELPDWAKGIQSFVAEKMTAINSGSELPLPLDPTGSLNNAKGMSQALAVRAEGIDSRKGMLLHAGAEHKSERIKETAGGIDDLVSQSEHLQSEYEDLANPQGWKKQLGLIGRLTGSTQKRTKEIITQRGEIEKTLKTVVDGAKADLKAPIGSDLLMRMGVDPDALDTAGAEISTGIGKLAADLNEGFQSAVEPMATYWDDAMISIAEVGVGGTANAIFGHALWNITEGVGTCGNAFKDLGGEVFESLKTMDFKRMANAGKIFASTMGEGLGQIVRGFKDAANGAAFFAAFSVTSGLLPAMALGGVLLVLLFLTLKFGDLREIAVGAFEVITGAAKVLWVAISSIKPIVERLGDAFKGVFAAMRGDFDPLKEAIANLKLEFEIMLANMGPGFGQVRDGLARMAKGFQPVIDKGILPMVDSIKAAFERLTDFLLDPFRNAIREFQQFSADLKRMALKVVEDVKVEFSQIFTTLTGAAKFAIDSITNFFDDLGSGLSNIINIATSTVMEIGQIFTTGFAKIGGAFKTAWDGINIGATGIEGIGKGLTLISEEVKSCGRQIFDSLGSSSEAVRSEIGKIGTSFVEANKDILTSFQVSFDRIGQLVPNLIEIFSNGINNFTAYFAVKFQSIFDVAQAIFNGIAAIAGKTWELGSLAFNGFGELVSAGLFGIHDLVAEQFSKIGGIIRGIGTKGREAFDSLLTATQPMTDGIKSIFTGTVRDLDNLVQTGLDGYTGMLNGISDGFATAFNGIKAAGVDLSTNITAIPSRITEAFFTMTGAIGSALTDEFESAKTSGSELLDALKGAFFDGTNQIGVMITGITSSFASVGDSITLTIENLKTTFAGLGEAIDTAMGNAFGGVKDKWQKTTGFMGKLMGKVAGESEETGQLILHNMAENSPGPTQRIRELYAFTAAHVANSLGSIATAAEANGAAIVDGMNPATLNQIAPVSVAIASPGTVAVGASNTVAEAPARSGGAIVKSLSGNTSSSSKTIGSLLEMSGQKGLSSGFTAVASGIDTVNNALGATKIAKEIGQDFKALSGVMKGFSAVDAASKIGDMATGLMAAGGAAWDAIKGFGQWISAKLFQTSIGVASEAAMAETAVAGAVATGGANLAVAGTNAVVAESFVVTGAAAGTAWSAILAPILPIIAAIAALIAIIFLVKAAFDNNFLGFGDFIYKIGDAIGGLVSIFTGFFSALWDGGMSIIGDVFGTLMSTIGEIFILVGQIGSILIAPFTEMFSAIMGIFSPIVALFPQLNSGMKGTSMLVNILLLPMRMFAEGLKLAITLVGFLVKGIVIVAGGLIAYLISPFILVAKIVTGLIGIFSAIGGAIWNVLIAPFQFVASLIAGIADQIGKLFSGPLGFLAGVFGMNPKVQPGAEVQQFSTGGFVTGAGGPTDDKIPAMLSNGEFVVGAASTARNRSFLEAINSGMAAEDALKLIDVPHPVGQLPDRASTGSGSTAGKVTIENHYNITVNFGNIVVEGATGEEAAQDFSRFLQTTEFQMAIQAALTQQVESMR